MPHPKKAKPYDDLRTQLTYAQEQTTIWRNKAVHEEMRAADLEKCALEEKRASDSCSMRLRSVEIQTVNLREQIRIRDEALVQMALRIAPYGDPASAR